jgi:hypothetical protein
MTTNHVGSFLLMVRFYPSSHSPGPVRQAFLCRVSKVHSPMYIRFLEYRLDVLDPLLG